MKSIFNFRRHCWLSPVVVLRAAAAQPSPPAPVASEPALSADLVDLDGDGDIDETDRALLEAAEVISIENKSDATKLAESARAVTVVDLRKARERAADLGEVLSRAHGIQVRRGGALGSAARFSLNGLYDDQIRFFIDGIPLELAGWTLGLANIPVDLVERVDVYRGVVPIGLGADALGGAIDLVTDPSWTNRASISYQVGSFGTHRASLGARAHDSVNGLALGLAVFTDRAKNDYPIDVEVTDDVGHLKPATVRRFHDGYVAGGAIVEAGVVERGPLKHALLRAFHVQYDKDLQHNAVMTVPYGDASYAGDSNGLAADLAIEAPRWRGRLVLGGSRSTVDFRDIGTNVYDWYGHVVRERRIPGEIGQSPTDERTFETGLFVRGMLDVALGSHQRLRIALAPSAGLRSGVDHLDPNPDGRDPAEAHHDLLQVVSGVEHELTARAGRLQNIAFAKHYLLATQVEDVRPGFMFVPISSTLQHVGLGDSARYQLSPQLIAKASYEWATRLPSVDELFGDGILVQQNPNLVPETSHNLNLGIQLDRDGATGSWGGEVAAFARLADHLIVLVGNDLSLSYQNVYAARIIGVEGSAGWIAPGEWASVTANATVQDIRNASSEGTFGAFEGDRIPNRPWLLGSLEASVRRRDTFRANDEIALFASSRYVHSFYRGWESQGLRQFKQVVPSQLVHGLGITYAARGVTPIITTLEVQNVTDARAYDSFGVQRPGRAVYLKLSGEL